MSKIPTKPLTASPGESIDFDIWARGIAAQNSKNPSKKPDERTYLRGLHNRTSIDQLRSAIAAVVPLAFVRVTSAWVDRTPQAYFQNKLGLDVNCEVGDILLVVRRRGPISFRSRAMLIQAKPLISPTATLPSNSSTKNEVDLYERSPKIDLWPLTKGKGGGLGQFDLAGDIKKLGGLTLSDQKHFRFLSICSDPADYGNPTSVPPTPWPNSYSALNMRWTPNYPVAGSDSFTDSVLNMAQLKPTTGEDCSVSARMPSWHKLVDALIKYTFTRVARSAGGPRQISAQFMMAGFLDPRTLTLNLFQKKTDNQVIQEMMGGMLFSTGFRYPDGSVIKKDLDLGGFVGNSLFSPGVENPIGLDVAGSNDVAPPVDLEELGDEDGGTPLVVVVDIVTPNEYEQ